ncbi:hypothetical protein [Candidatus Odyssella thessalonicensis]|uniref:hypothetical protein n=1 Tax=Candidatus Odyssella thessalonicensis TaxID=84647 RepID=UPI000225B490|nr:hypothetical protein [Candidatus Odyssella thessalonicensis]
MRRNVKFLSIIVGLLNFAHSMEEEDTICNGIDTTRQGILICRSKDDSLDYKNYVNKILVGKENPDQIIRFAEAGELSAYKTIMMIESIPMSEKLALTDRFAQYYPDNAEMFELAAKTCMENGLIKKGFSFYEQALGTSKMSNNGFLRYIYYLTNYRAQEPNSIPITWRLLQQWQNKIQSDISQKNQFIDKCEELITAYDLFFKIIVCLEEYWSFAVEAIKLAERNDTPAFIKGIIFLQYLNFKGTPLEAFIYYNIGYQFNDEEELQQGAEVSKEVALEKQIQDYENQINDLINENLSKLLNPPLFSSKHILKDLTSSYYMLRFTNLTLTEEEVCQQCAKSFIQANLSTLLKYKGENSYIIARLKSLDENNKYLIALIDFIAEAINNAKKS